MWGEVVELEPVERDGERRKRAEQRCHNYFVPGNIPVRLSGRITAVINHLARAGVVLTILADVTYVFLCSLLMGIAFGLGLSYLFKKISSFTEYHIKEASLILLTGYVVYLVGEALGLSGVMALFTTAIIFSRYGYSNLSHESQQGTLLAFDSIRYIFQGFIFAYLGATLLTMHLNWRALGMALFILVMIPLIRFLSVVILPLIFKLSGRPFPLVRS